MKSVLEKISEDLFVKGAKCWIKDRKLSIEENKTFVEYVDKVIKNLITQKEVKLESIKLDEEAIKNYIKMCKEDGYIIEE